MDSSTYIAILGLALLSGMTTLIGVWLAYKIRNKFHLIVIGMGFSTGIMILISFFELFPEAIAEVGWVKSIIVGAVGFGFSALLNYFIPHTHLIKEKEGVNRPILTAAYLLAFGLILHDLPEGFAMANSYVSSYSLGIMVAITIALHNIPEEFAIAVPLIAAGKSKKSLFKIAIISGLAEPVGALIGLLAVNIFIGLNAYILAFSAGIMIYISLHELLPMAQKYRKPVFLVTGLLVSILVFLVLGIAFP